MKNAEKIAVICNFCGTTILKYKYKIRNTNFCNKNCKAKFQKGKPLSAETKYKLSIKSRGKNNPNYNNRGNDEQRQNLSDKVKKGFQDDPERRKAVSTVHKGKKLSAETLAKIHKPGRQYGQPHTEKSKKLIGQKSAAKFTQDYKNKHRRAMELQGVGIPLADKSDYEIYFNEANGVSRMFNLINDINQVKLLNECGVYNAKNNRKGCVRDHIYSRHIGFNDGVFPEILRHPCNCQIITHGDNVRKRVAKHHNIAVYTKDQLFSKIKEYIGNGKEHQIVLNKIEEYEKGERGKNEYSRRTNVC